VSEVAMRRHRTLLRALCGAELYKKAQPMVT
jgi:hypothetical protein